MIATTNDYQLSKDIAEDNKLIELLAHWMWENGWINAKIVEESPEHFHGTIMLKEISRERLDSLLAARKRGEAIVELFAHGDFSSEQREAVAYITSYAQSFLSPIAPSLRDSICLKTWNLLSLRVKAKALLDLAGATKPSDCRFSSTCNSCSDTCPRLGARKELDVNNVVL